jgi:hypothetical protein
VNPAASDGVIERDDIDRAYERDDLKPFTQVSGYLRWQEMIISAAADRIGVDHADARAAYYGFDEVAELFTYRDWRLAGGDEENWKLDVARRVKASSWLGGSAERTPEQRELWLRLWRELPWTVARFRDGSPAGYGLRLARMIRFGSVIDRPRPPVRRHGHVGAMARRGVRRRRQRCRSPGRPGDDDPDLAAPEAAA